MDQTTKTRAAVRQNMHLRRMRTTKTKAPEGVRRNTVSYLCPSGGGNAVPFIRLSGHWLEDTGFDIGDSILVATNKGKLTITIEKKEE